jgi:anti-anti-sigma factor
MLIITVETQAANVNFLLDSPRAGVAAGELARSCCTRLCVSEQRVSLDLEGSIRAPIDGVLRSRVESLLHGGARRVVLDLSGVSHIDAAGVGELIHLFNTAAAAGRVLEIGRMSPHVRRVLDVAGVLELLAADDVEHRGARSTSS